MNVGTLSESSGSVTVTRNGQVVSADSGLMRGDIVETGSDGAAVVIFADGTYFQLRENTRLDVDEYEFDPFTQEGNAEITLLEGVLLWVGGFIDRNADHDDDEYYECENGACVYVGPTTGGIRGTTFTVEYQVSGRMGTVTYSVTDGIVDVMNRALEKRLLSPTVRALRSRNSCPVSGHSQSTTLGVRPPKAVKASIRQRLGMRESNPKPEARHLRASPSSDSPRTGVWFPRPVSPPRLLFRKGAFSPKSTGQ